MNSTETDQLSMFTDYFRDECEKETITQEAGFITYHLSGKECFVGDVYIKPKYRGKAEACRLLSEVEKIAKENGCEWLSANTYFDGKRFERYTAHVKKMIDAGFTILRVEKSDIIWMKPVKGA